MLHDNRQRAFSVNHSLSAEKDENAAEPAKRSESGTQRTVVLVGLMGAGKSTVGRLLAETLGLPFHDSDDEIEKAADMSIPEIFEKLGEPEFRRGERRVIARLLGGGPIVLATGGGAFMDPETRAEIRDKAVSVWLKADLDVLWRRVAKKGGRPLLNQPEPKKALARLLQEREPVYAEADHVVISRDGPHMHTVNAILEKLGS